MSQSTHEVIIRLVDQASTGIKQIEKSTQGVIDTIEKNREGIQAIGIASGVAFAGMSIGISKAIKESTELENAMKGLNSIVVGTNQDWGKAQKAIESYTKDGLVSTAEAATSLKNLLARGFSLDEATRLMDAFKNSATYGRQASLGLGEAVKTATEGIKNENSILVDNAGVTKNVSIMWKEYAEKIGKTVNDLTIAEKRQAEYNGILEETKFQMGDATKMADSYSGAVARTDASIKMMWASIGDGLKPAMKELMDTMTPLISAVTDFARENPKLTATIVLGTTALVGITMALAGFALIIPPAVLAIKTLGGALMFLTMNSIGLTVLAIAGLVTAGILLYQNWETVKAKIVEIWNGIKLFIFSAIESIKGKIGEWMNTARTAISQGWEAVKQKTSEIWEGIKNTISSIVQSINSFLKNVFGIDIAGSIGAGWESAKNKTVQIWEGIKGAVGQAVQWIMDKLQPLLDLMGAVKEKADALGGYVSGKVKQASDWMNKPVMKVTSSDPNDHGLIGNLFSGMFRASGGPVAGGSPYIVGEKGPELFVPGMSGMIVPNHKLGGSAPSISINLGTVNVYNEADENRLVSKIRDTLTRELRTARLFA